MEELDETVRGGIIASCQPLVNGPLDKDEIVTAMALACVAGGASALRIEGAGRVAAVKKVCQVPVIGIVKRDLLDSDVRITPLLDDVEDLANAGADIIAFDSTDRLRPVPRESVIERIVAADCYAMADCACLGDVQFAVEKGVDFIGTTLSGYVGEEIPVDPDNELLIKAVQIAERVIAEGRYNTPGQAKEARRLGAWGVTVGTALTRLETITNWFVESVSELGSEADALLAINTREARL